MHNICAHQIQLSLRFSCHHGPLPCSRYSVLPLRRQYCSPDAVPFSTLSPYLWLQQAVYLAPRTAWSVIPGKRFSPITDLSRQIQVPLAHSHNVLLICEVQAQMSRHPLRVLGVAGEEHAFRTQHFLALENMHSMFERFAVKRHHPPGLREEERLPDFRKCPALRSQLDKVVLSSFSQRAEDLLSLWQNM